MKEKESIILSYLNQMASTKQFLEKQDCENPYDDYDGSTEKGFLMKVIPTVFSDEENGVKNPFYGIVSIEPYMNFYAK